VDAAVTRIKQATGNHNLHPYVADLSDQSQVCSLAAAVLSDHPAIDCLINNAGAHEDPAAVALTGVTPNTTGGGAH